jgi:flagellar motor switch/type III secretory pathway protein FliN
VRDLPDPGPTGRVAAAALDDVPLTLRATLAGGTIDAATFVELRPGDVVRLDTQVGYPGSLKLGGQTIASGTCGSRASRAAFQVHEIRTRGIAP